MGGGGSGVNETRIPGLQGEKTVNGSAEPGRGRVIVWGPRQRAMALESLPGCHVVQVCWDSSVMKEKGFSCNCSVCLSLSLFSRCLVSVSTFKIPLISFEALFLP